MSVDVAESLAEVWALHRGSPADPDDFAPLCAELAEAGLLDPDEEALSAHAVGPYRIAVTPYQGAVGDFIQVFIGVTVTAIASADPVSTAVPGYLAGGVRTFVELLRRGVVFHRGEPDECRWATLMFVRWRNKGGEEPSPATVVSSLGERGWAGEAVEDALAWLQSPRAMSHVDRARLLRTTDTGGLEACV